MVSVRFDPDELRLLRRLAPRGKVSQFVREATMREVRRVGAVTGGGTPGVPGVPGGVTDAAGALRIAGPASTAAPSTRICSVAATVAEGRSGPPAMWGGLERGEAGTDPPPTVA